MKLYFTSRSPVIVMRPAPGLRRVRRPSSRAGAVNMLAAVQPVPARVAVALAQPD